MKDDANTIAVFFKGHVCSDIHFSVIPMQLVGNASGFMGLRQCWCIWASYNCKFLNCWYYCQNSKEDFAV